MVAVEAPQDIARLCTLLGVVVLLWSLPRPLGGLYLDCPCRRLRTLIVNREASEDERQSVLARALVAVCQGRHAEWII